MSMIIKRSGKEETFEANKISNSMRNAGVSQETALEITGRISFNEGITTSDVRNQVIGGIKNREPQAAKRYESYPKKNHEN